MKIFKKVKYREKRIIYLGQIAIAEYCPKKYFKLFPKSEEEIMLDKLNKLTNKKHDAIFHLRAGLGEAYIFFCTIQKVLKDNGIKKPCFTSHRSYYSDLCKLFYPTIPFYQVDVPPSELNKALITRKRKYKNIYFNVNPSTIKEVWRLWENYRQGKEKRHYIEILKEYNEVYELVYKQPIISESLKQGALNKIKGINKDNFVFLVPDANFFHSVSDAFWKNIKVLLEEKGYDCIFNSASLTIPEAYYLATLSKGIIAIRGGFCEILSAINAPKHIIYTKNNVEVPNSLDVFTLKKYPNVNQDSVFEYICNQDKENENEVMEKILECFGGKNHEVIL